MCQSGGNRRVPFDELALLQLRPELRRDLDLHGAVVSDDLLLAGGADNQGRGNIRRCGELQRRRPEIDAVPFRYLAQLFALFEVVVAAQLRPALPSSTSRSSCVPGLCGKLESSP